MGGLFKGELLNFGNVHTQNDAIFKAGHTASPFLLSNRNQMSQISGAWKTPCSCCPSSYRMDPYMAPSPFSPALSKGITPPLIDRKTPFTSISKAPPSLRRPPPPAAHGQGRCWVPPWGVVWVNKNFPAIFWIRFLRQPNRLILKDGLNPTGLPIVEKRKSHTTKR